MNYLNHTQRTIITNRSQKNHSQSSQNSKNQTLPKKFKTEEGNKKFQRFCLYDFYDS